MPDEDLLSGLSINRSGDRSERPRRALLLSLAVCALAGAAIGFWLLSGDGGEAGAAQAAESPAAVMASTVTSAAPARQAAPDTPAPILDASGYVVAMRIATVSSRSVGRVDQVLVEEGMEVEQGQVLARLDTVHQRIELDLSRARLERAEAVYRESENRLREADLALSRAERLHGHARGGMISDELLDNARLRVDQMHAELDRQAADIHIAEQEIRLQEQRIEDNIIRAPFSGVVVQKNAQPGEIISPSTSAGSFTRTGICTIVDMSSLEIEVDVNESYINRVSVGQSAEATLDAYPSLRLPAEVSAIVPTANRQRATIKVRVKFRELDPRILPDMGVKVSFFEQ